MFAVEAGKKEEGEEEAEEEEEDLAVRIEGFLIESMRRRNLSSKWQWRMKKCINRQLQPWNK
jgi:hypothetical protein